MLPQMLENTPVKAQPLRRVNVRLLWCVMLRLERKSAVGGRRESGGRAGRAAASPDGKPSKWGKKTLKAKTKETPKSETAGSGGAIKRGLRPQRKDAGAEAGRSGKALADAAPLRGDDRKTGGMGGGPPGTCSRGVETRRERNERRRT